MGKGSGNCNDRPSMITGETMLREPTQLQLEVLHAWVNEFDKQHRKDYSGIEHDETDELCVKEDLGISRNAAIARLSGLVRAGWLQTSGDRGEVSWKLTKAGYENLPFFLPPDWEVLTDH